MGREVHLSLGVLALVILIVGCGTFQTAKVLDEATGYVGASVLGIATGRSGDSGYFEIPALVPSFELYGRSYLAPKADWGLAISILPRAILADVKYQLIEVPFYLSASVGAGMVGFRPLAQITVLAGSDVSYAGIKSTVALAEWSLSGLANFNYILMGIAVPLGKYWHLFFEGQICAMAFFDSEISWINYSFAGIGITIDFITKRR